MANRAAVLVPALLAFVLTTAMTSPTELTLQKDLGSLRGARFESLIKQWETQYGTRAAAPLWKLASHPKKLKDTERYIALLAAVKLGASPSVQSLKSLVSDRSWMVRVAALRTLALSAQSPAQFLPVISAALKDSALVVRTQAVDTLNALRIPGPAGANDLYWQAIEDSQNYHQGRPMWASVRALDQLATQKKTELKALTPRIQKFLQARAGKIRDPKFISTLRSLI